MSTEYSESYSHCCYNCHKDNFTSAEMHKIDDFYFTIKGNDTKYQLYLCDHCLKIAHICCVCGNIFFSRHPGSGPGDFLRMPECSRCLDKEYERWWGCEDD